MSYVDTDEAPQSSYYKPKRKYKKRKKAKAKRKYARKAKALPKNIIVIDLDNAPLKYILKLIEIINIMGFVYISQELRRKE